jgi:hypothetical protein
LSLVTNIETETLGGRLVDRAALTRMAGSSAPNFRQLLGRERL